MNQYINARDVKRLGYINQNADDTLIMVIINRIQDTVIQPILGTALHEKLLTAIGANTLTANETTLVKDYISKVVISAVDMRSIDAISYDIRAKIVGKATDENITANSESENDRLYNALRKDYVFYRKKLIDYLCEKHTLFPELDDNIYKYQDKPDDEGNVAIPISFV